MLFADWTLLRSSGYQNTAHKIQFHTKNEANQVEKTKLKKHSLRPPFWQPYLTAGRLFTVSNVISPFGWKSMSSSNPRAHTEGPKEGLGAGALSETAGPLTKGQIAFIQVSS